MVQKINAQFWSALTWERMCKTGCLGLDQVILALQHPLEPATIYYEWEGKAFCLKDDDISDYFQISEANPAYDKYNVGLRIKPKYCVEDTLVSITHMASIIICLPFRR